MPPEIIDAATLVLLRERRDAPPDLLMVERGRTLRFAPGALVFPGGRVDSGDRALAAALGDERGDSACRIAAIRETIEEAGVAVAIDPAPDAAAVAVMRAALLDGATLGTVLGGRRLLLDRLVPFARWLPDHLARRFDTRFYLARAPDEATGSPDGGESVALAWDSAAAMLARGDGHAAQLVYPTRRTLERLARFADFAAVAADATAHPLRTITPWIEPRDGVAHLCIPDDLGFPVTAEPLGGAIRG